MSVTPIRKARALGGRDRPFQTAVTDLIANELIFAVVGPVGSGTSEIADSLKELLTKAGYDTSILKARQVIQEWARAEGIPIPAEPGLAQSRALQDAGDLLRKHSQDGAAVAVGLVSLIRQQRASKQSNTLVTGQPIEPDGQRRAYILDSLRHPHEVALLRGVYQDAFCLIGVFCQDEIRHQRLCGEKYKSSSQDEVDVFMARDENAPEPFGQKVADAFHLSDYFIDNTVQRFIRVGTQSEANPDWDVADQLGRLIDILTHKRLVRPRPGETGMFHAHGARMRSSCLSRQVGAALMDRSGSLIATGTNEVPRAGGGVYGGVFLAGDASDPPRGQDFRCFAHNGYCSNTREQNEIIKDLFKNIDEFKEINLSDDLIRKIRRTRIGQLLEFSRAVHAEMDALLAAARSGARTVGTRLYVTTFPCHNCARHIVAAGVDEVQYIEPYLKSHAIPLHGDAIVTDPKEWNRFSPDEHPDIDKRNPNVLFRPFIGVAPRLYRRAFLKIRDLKDSFTGSMLSDFASVEGQAVARTLRVSYADAEARLEALKEEVGP